jgi:Tfp pilus assembly protein PilV
VTANAVTCLSGPGRRSSRLVAKLRGEDGVGLIELLIAILVLNVGIFATLAAFTSGALALRRASHASTAAAIADKKMECFRDTSFANITWAPGAPCYATSVTGADGRPYSLSATVSYQPPPGPTSVKVVTLTISDVNDHNKLLVTSSSTFSQCGQDLTNSACGGS